MATNIPRPGVSLRKPASWAFSLMCCSVVSSLSLGDTEILREHVLGDDVGRELRLVVLPEEAAHDRRLDHGLTDCDGVVPVALRRDQLLAEIRELDPDGVLGALREPVPRRRGEEVSPG